MCRLLELTARAVPGVPLLRASQFRIPHSAFRIPRCGLTLIELLVAAAVTSMIAVTLAAMARGVQLTSSYSEGLATATQHARVALERIERNVSGATANQNFPGAALFSDTIGGQSVPDTLVVWHPSGTAANPTGLPLFSEVVVYCPNPAAPNQLLEITWPTNTAAVPALTDTSDWSTNLATMKAGGSGVTQTMITDLMRASPPSGSGTSVSSLAGCVRFAVVQNPSSSQYASYKAGTLAWSQLAWAQGIYGATTGLAQTWVRVELQMLPGYTAQSDPAGQQVLPFFGSATLNFQLPH